MSYREDPVFQTVHQMCAPGAVAQVLTAAWQRWSGTRPHALHVALGYTNYKPFQRARVMAEVIVVPEGGRAPARALHLFLHVFADASAAAAEAEQGEARGFLSCQGPPLVHVPQWRTVIWTLPNAPNLAELAQLLEVTYFCRHLVPSAAVAADRPFYPAPKLMRYVPLKRALLTWDDPYTCRRYFVKLHSAAEAPRVARNVRHIASAYERGELAFSVPQLIAYNPACHTLVMTEVPGNPFTDTMRRASPEPFTRVGHMLAQLHGCSVRPEAVWTPEHELATLRRHMADFRRVLPHLGTPLELTMATLEAAAPSLPGTPVAPIHGNLFGDQILVSRHGMGLVDWDTLALGDPLYDVGRLIAHLIYLAGREEIAPAAASACAEALLESYEAESGRPVDRHCLAWHVTSQLLLRGKISSLRQLPEGWQTHLAFVVTEAARVIAGRSRYLWLPALCDIT